MLCISSPWGGWQYQLPRKGRHPTDGKGLQLTITRVRFSPLGEIVQLIKHMSTVTACAQTEFSSGKRDTAMPPQNTKNPTTDHFVHKNLSVLTVSLVVSRQKLPQFSPDISRREEEKEVTLGKKPATIVCSQKIATNLSISANVWLWQQESKPILPPLLRVGKWWASQQFLSDKQ